MKTNLFERRLAVLEGRTSAATSGGCDLWRRMAKYRAWFGGAPWECRNPTPENIRRNEEKLARYKKYFDDLERCSG